MKKFNLKKITTAAVTAAMLMSTVVGITASADAELVPAELPFHDDISWGTATQPSGGFSAKGYALSYTDDGNEVLDGINVNDAYFVFSGSTYWKAYNGRIAAKGNRFTHGNLQIGVDDFVKNLCYTFSADIIPIGMADTSARNSAGIKFDSNLDGTSYYWFGFEDPGSTGANAYTVSLRKSPSGDTYNSYGAQLLATSVLPEEYRNIAASANRPFNLYVSITKEEDKNTINYELRGTKEDASSEVIWSGTYVDNDPLSGGSVFLYKTGSTEVLFDNIAIDKTGMATVSEPVPATLPFEDALSWATDGSYTNIANSNLNYGGNKTNEAYTVIYGSTAWKAADKKIYAKGNRYSNGNLLVGPTDFVAGKNYTFSADILPDGLANVNARNAYGIKFDANVPASSYYWFGFNGTGIDGTVSDTISLRKAPSGEQGSFGSLELASIPVPEEYRNIAPSANRPFTFTASLSRHDGLNVIDYEVLGTKADGTKEVIWSGTYEDTQNPLAGTKVMLYATGQTEAAFDNIKVSEKLSPAYVIAEYDEECDVMIDTTIAEDVDENDKFICAFYDMNNRLVDVSLLNPVVDDSIVIVTVPKCAEETVGRLFVWDDMLPQIATILLK